jgi:anionic cell wall polymer biosynthesis LytR-Cps2A-Psr (LCP) family protein
MTDGVRASAQMILDNFEVTSDHYMVIDLDQLPTLVDAVGGLPINIPERTTDPWIGTVIEAGPQILTGEQLRAYARAIPDSDFARIQRSNLILHALRQKLLEPSVWMKLPVLYDRFKKMIVTDLSPQQIFSFFCLLQEVPREEIVMKQVEPEWTSPGPSDSLLWDKDKITTALKQLDLLP